MRTRLAILSLISFFAFAATAQKVENDDMYFNSKDRVKLKSLKSSGELSTYASAKKTTKEELKKENYNPTDSYSARNVNPEFAARTNAQTAQSDNQDYFVNDYRYNTASNFNNWNNNFNNWYNNPWYRANYFGPSIYGWNSPYYGFNDPYSSPWYDPYWNYSGWSTSFSYFWGNSWNYGWGGNYNHWNRPYCGWASSWAWGPSFGWGPAWGGGGWYGYPRTVVVVNNYEGGRNVTYSKRPTRSSVMMANEQGNTTRTRSTYVSPTNTSRGTTTGGRAKQDEYYNRSWRSSSVSESSNSDSRSRYMSNSYNNSSNTPSRSNSSYNSNSYNSGRTSSPGTSSGSSRTSSSSSGSGSNGRTRGN